MLPHKSILYRSDSLHFLAIGSRLCIQSDIAAMAELADTIIGMTLRLVSHVTRAFHAVPGSAVIVRYVRSSHQNDIARSIVELLLLLLAIRYLMAKSYSPDRKRKHISLSEEEIEDLVDEWLP